MMPAAPGFPHVVVQSLAHVWYLSRLLPLCPLLSLGGILVPGWLQLDEKVVTLI